MTCQPSRVLVLGSGGIRIGQGGEFDYCGTQALKAFRDEGLYTVLLNPNIATVQSTEGLADAVYFLPVQCEFAERVIQREGIDAIALGFGGQSALACGLALADAGILDRHSVQVLGTSIQAIRDTEDRDRFRRRLAEINIATTKGLAVRSMAEALQAAKAIGYPVMVRGAFSLGGDGAGVARNGPDLGSAVKRVLAKRPEVAIEAYLDHYQEIELEIVRDTGDNCICVCGLENVDPVGIHTGDSVVVAPIQTLDDHQIQQLREAAFRIVRHLGIVGECNIQFACEPESGAFKVIELNARLSRSSALASKATGYPLAFVAAKVALGQPLWAIRNPVTGATAFHEPALDYVVCKMPRWDLAKFKGVSRTLGPEMKSVGEAMAIGRTLAEAMQKAMRMGDNGLFDFSSQAPDDLAAALATPSPDRLQAAVMALGSGWPLSELVSLTGYAPYFIAELARMARTARDLADLQESRASLSRELLVRAKREGFSDRQIAGFIGSTETDVRALRHGLGIRPHLARLGDVELREASGNAFYLSYGLDRPEIPKARAKRLLVLGAGCYRIGSSVEFDWSCVQGIGAARELGYEVVLVNCNPATASTDHDAADILIFEELSIEALSEIAHQVNPLGTIVSLGGQGANDLASSLVEAGIQVLGTSPEAIARAEDRVQFSALCDDLAILQPRWTSETRAEKVRTAVADLGGFPVLVRPSHVLAGDAMCVVWSQTKLEVALSRAAGVSPEHPVILTRFETHAREIEYDAVASRGDVVLEALAEHLELAGVHSGDATLMVPPQNLAESHARTIRRIGAKLARALAISGPFNLQCLVCTGQRPAIKVIECNLRASRTFPLVSKATGRDFAQAAIRAILGEPLSASARRPPAYVVVKMPQFSFRPLVGADPISGVEMHATGEVACFADRLDEAIVSAALAAGFRIPRHAALLTCSPAVDGALQLARLLEQLGLRLYGPESQECEWGKHGWHAVALASDAKAMGKLLDRHAIDLVVAPARGGAWRPHIQRSLRQQAILRAIPVLTDLNLARRLALGLLRAASGPLPIRSWQHYLAALTLAEVPVSHSLLRQF